MNKIDLLFKELNEPALSIYVTAGYPDLNSLKTILPALEQAGVHMVEVGFPFSDPMADGPVIQASSKQALDNGMSLKVLFNQLKEIEVKIPIVLMGYFNPVLQFGINEFLSECRACGVSGTIIPDLPIDIYQQYKTVFTEHQVHHIFLVTPQTPDDRIRFLASETNGFLYAVSTASITGSKGIAQSNPAYLSKLRKLAPETPIMIGFGIKTAQDFKNTHQYADGAIIGSKFIEVIQEKNSGDASHLNDQISTFISTIIS